MKLVFADYIQKRFGLKPRILSKKEECELIRAWKEKKDERALSQLMASHLFLVMAIAVRFFGKFKHLFDELVQEGSTGLLEAIQRFDIDRGTRLSTYASFRIRQSMRTFLCDQGRIVQFPNKQMPFQKGGQLLRLKNMKNIPFLLNDTELDECARILGITRRQLMEFDRYLFPDTFLSLNTIISPSREGESGMETYQDRLCDKGPSPEDVCMLNEQESMRRTIVEKILSSLSEKERMILAERKMNDEPATLEELGKKLGVSKERVRQIELKALQKLRKALLNPELRKMADGNYNNILSP